MHALQLVELAGLVTEHAPVLVDRPGSFVAARLADYWAACRCRADRWSRSLHEFVGQGPARRLSAHHWRGTRWSRTTGLLEEIIASEVLNRVAAAVFRLHDARHGIEESGPIGQSTLSSHAHLRRKTLSILTAAEAARLPHSDELNHLRRSCETWTDIMLSRLVPLGPIDDLVFEAWRAADFADDFRQQQQAGTIDQAWSMYKTSLKIRFAQSNWQNTPNADLNGSVASALLACFGPAMFDSHGLLRTHWLDRLENNTDDAQRWIRQIDTDDSVGGGRATRWPT